MREQDVAMELIQEAQKARAISGVPFTTIDVNEFGEGKLDLEVFKDCVAVLGFKCIPIEDSHLRNTPMKNKYVIIGR